MTTRVIGIKEFRQNITKLSKQSCKKKGGTRFIVMRHTVPIMEVKMIDDEDGLTDELMLEAYKDEIEEALRQVERGEVYTSEEVLAMLKK